MSVGGTAGKSAGRSGPAVKIIPLPHALGAEVRCGDVRALDDASAAAIRQAFLDHLVLLFRMHKTACVGSRPVEQPGYAPPHSRGPAFAAQR